MSVVAFLIVPAGEEITGFIKFFPLMCNLLEKDSCFIKSSGTMLNVVAECPQNRSMY